MNAERLITYSVLFGALVITVADAPNIRAERYIGLLVGGTFLTLAAQVAPQVAGPLALLLLAVLIFGEHGERALDRVRRVLP